MEIIVYDGNFTTSSSQDHDIGDYLSAGTMTIKGDFTQTNGNTYNFDCEGTHKVILNGNNNVQKVTFSSTNSHFNILKLTKDKDAGYIMIPEKCWNTLIENPNRLIGDTNLDGYITISDVTAIQRHLAEFDVFNDEQIALADTNGDGEINIADATHLQMYLAEYDVVLGKR